MTALRARGSDSVSTSSSRRGWPNWFASSLPPRTMCSRNRARAGSADDPLAARVRRVIAVEIDRDLAGAFQQQLAADGHGRPGDFLEVDVEATACAGENQPLRVVGNLPTTSPHRSCSSCCTPPGHGRALTDATLMLQKEVADRLSARPGSADYGSLAIQVCPAGGRRAGAGRCRRGRSGRLRKSHPRSCGCGSGRLGVDVGSMRHVRASCPRGFSCSGARLWRTPSSRLPTLSAARRRSDRRARVSTARSGLEELTRSTTLRPPQPSCAIVCPEVVDPSIVAGGPSCPSPTLEQRVRTPTVSSDPPGHAEPKTMP